MPNDCAPRKLSMTPSTEAPRFSICTMVTDPVMYAQMRASCLQAGFVEPQAEYLWIDNVGINGADAYQSIRRFLSEARGEYIVLCHQDVILDHDRIDKLESCISELERMDPLWALLGNAGGVCLGRLVHRISDPHGSNIHSAGLPIKVQSLDENFILIKRSSNPGISADLSGFHMYGLDLCLLATMRGYNAYVVDFHITHLGRGVLDASFYASRDALLEKYRKVFAPAWIQTTCTSLFLSGNRWLNRLLNRPRFIKWAKSLIKRRSRKSGN